MVLLIPKKRENKEIWPLASFRIVRMHVIKVMINIKTSREKGITTLRIYQY